MSSQTNQITPSAAELLEILDFCRDLMTAAGEIALRYFRQDLAVDNKLRDGRFDPVTRADREIETFLRDRLRQAFPTYGVIGEEGGTTQGTSDLNWIVDPIDGTKAFISGLPTWGMLLGLMQGAQPLAGLMFQPFTGELFVGSGAGAHLYHKGRRQALAARGGASLADAILYCTHESMFANHSNRQAFRRVAERVRLQRYGGDCYAYCMLALGRVDLVIEDTLQPYDIIPLIPIVEAAGGVVTDLEGGSPAAGGFVVAAANRTLHRQALDVVRQR